MVEFEEVDLSKKYNIVTNDDEFKRGIGKWLFNHDYNILGNVLNCVDETDDIIVPTGIDSWDLQFNYVNSYGEELTVYLLDEKQDDERYFLVSKKGGDIGYYNLRTINNKLYVNHGMLLFEDNERDKKPRIRKLAG